jgi:heme/copper-type cytochrome/quinol oxidase subunit 2
MVRFTTIAKKVGQVFFMVLILLFLSLIPLLIAANLLSLFRWLDDRGWSHLALLAKIVAIVLGVGTIILMVCGLVVVFVLTVRDIIRDFESKDESQAV